MFHEFTLNSNSQLWVDYGKLLTNVIQKIKPKKIIDFDVVDISLVFYLSKLQIGEIFVIDNFNSNLIKLQQLREYSYKNNYKNLYFINSTVEEYLKKINFNVDIIKINDKIINNPENIYYLYKKINDNGLLIFYASENLDFYKNFIKNKNLNFICINKYIIISNNKKYLYDFSKEISNNDERKYMKNKKTKILMMSMFKNEAKTIGRMLESCYRYIDYYVLQDNGSTDGTPEIVADFFKDKNIPGFVYKVEEGWVGFGWNRDHLVQTAQKADHGCDWILKMDCDEVLVVDENFDWSIFDNTNIQAFHVPAVADNCLYHRAWMYNARLPWRFNHDTAHETVYMDVEGIKENFQCSNLPYGFRQIGYTDGQSYGVRTKYITDSLILEEKMIREDNMLADSYHFWYIGKSYFDAFRSDFYPLKRKHSEEFARRSIFYFKEWINFAHNYENTGHPDRIDEMAYYAMMSIGLIYRYLNDTKTAIEYMEKAGPFSPPRNEHYMRLAEIYCAENMYKELFEVTEKMLHPERKNPFPTYTFIIETDSYYDTGNKIKELNLYAREKLNIVEGKKPVENILYNVRINQNMKKRLFIVDNFYENVDDIRKFALSLEFKQDLRWYKGFRSSLTFRPPSIKESFEKIIGEKITVWDEHAFNGCFQITTAEDPQVYHHDAQKWAAMIYLTPDAPIESGTRLHRSTISGARHADDQTIDRAFTGGFYDSTKFDTVDNAGNIYNRLVIMDAKCIHSAGPYFGTNFESGRLIHLFFFD